MGTASSNYNEKKRFILEIHELKNNVLQAEWGLWATTIFFLSDDHGTNVNFF